MPSSRFILFGSSCGGRAENTVMMVMQGLNARLRIHDAASPALEPASARQQQRQADRGNCWSLSNLRPSMALSLGISWQFNMPKPGGGPLSWRLLKMFQISDGLWENILIGWDLSSEETVQELRFKKLATWSITEWIAKLPDTENSSRSSNSLDGSLKLPNPPFRNPLPSGLGRKILLTGNSPCHIQPRQQACCLCCKHLTSRNPCCWNFSGKGIPGRRNVSKEAAMCEMLQEICHLIYHINLKLLAVINRCLLRSRCSSLPSNLQKLSGNNWKACSAEESWSLTNRGFGFHLQAGNKHRSTQAANDQRKFDNSCKRCSFAAFAH